MNKLTWQTIGTYPDVRYVMGQWTVAPVYNLNDLMWASLDKRQAVAIGFVLLYGSCVVGKYRDRRAVIEAINDETIRHAIRALAKMGKVRPVGTHG